MNPQLVPNIARMSRCDVVILPMTSEIMMGKLAQQELESMHTACHAILQYPDINFTEDELRGIYTIIQTAQKKLGLELSESEVSILKRIKKLIKID